MLTIKAEAHPGMTILEVAGELAPLAQRLGSAMECDFNGIAVHAHPGDTAEGLVMGYERAVERKTRFAFSAERMR